MVKSSIRKKRADKSLLAARLPRGQDARVLVDRIRPTVKLSELTKPLAEQGERVRATLQLPRLPETLPFGTVQLPGLDDVREMTRVAKSAIRSPLVEPTSSAPPSQPTKRRLDAGYSMAVGSARELGLLVRMERENRKLSQQEFADIVGVGRRFVSELENGKTTLEFDKVLQVAAAAGLDVSARRR